MSHLRPHRANTDWTGNFARLHESGSLTSLGRLMNKGCQIDPHYHGARSRPWTACLLRCTSPSSAWLAHSNVGIMYSRNAKDPLYGRRRDSVWGPICGSKWYCLNDGYNLGSSCDKISQLENSSTMVTRTSQQYSYGSLTWEGWDLAPITLERLINGFGIGFTYGVNIQWWELLGRMRYLVRHTWYETSSLSSGIMFMGT